MEVCILSYSVFFFNLFYFLTLQYCIGFAIYQHESATGIHFSPLSFSFSLIIQVKHGYVYITVKNKIQIIHKVKNESP